MGCVCMACVWRVYGVCMEYVRCQASQCAGTCCPPLGTSFSSWFFMFSPGFELIFHSFSALELVLSSFSKVAQRRDVGFHHCYVDLTSPKTYFGALNELAIALDGTNRRYRKGIPVEYMQEKIVNAMSGYKGFVVILIDEADNVRPTLSRQ